MPEIDNWSVGFTIYELFQRKIPISYSQQFFGDILSSWKSDLFLALDQREKTGLAYVEDVISLLMTRLVKMKQQERMKLRLVYTILKYLEDYVNKLFKEFF